MSVTEKHLNNMKPVPKLHFYMSTITRAHYIILVLLLNLLVNSHAKAPEDFRIPWIPNVASRAMMEYFPYGENASSLCSLQGRLVQQFSSNFTMWATRMIDSSSKGPSGLLYGNSYDFGHYDECISTTALDDTLKGQFVMVSLKFYLEHSFKKDLNIGDLSHQNEFPRSNDSYWILFEHLEAFGLRKIKRRSQMNLALCVPDSCSSDDIIYSVNRTISPVLIDYGIFTNVSILKEYSFTRFEKQWTTGSISFLSVTLTLIIIASSATLYDCCYMKRKYAGKFGKKWLNFSVRYNLYQITKVEKSIPVLSGMKVVSMFLIICGHRMLMTMFSPIHNTYDNEMVIGDFLNTFYLNGIILVDTFLVITGFLSFKKMLKTIENYGRINILKCIFQRYMRLTPAYGFILAYVIWINPQLEGGPMARNVIWNSDQCSQAWWTHLLYINNYIQPENQCIIPAWYMAADMQLYVFCSIIAFITWKCNRFTGVTVLLTTFILSLIGSAAIFIHKKYEGATLLYLSDFTTYFTNSEFIETYFQIHFRATPYIIGMLAACISRKLEGYNQLAYKNKHKWLIIILTPLQLLSMNLSILSAWRLYQGGRQYSSIEAMVFTVFHRIFWAVPIAWIIVIHSSHLYAPFEKILGLPFFEPLNKVGYSVLLIHTPLQLYLIGLNRSPSYLNWLTLWWMSAGDIMVSYSAAFILYFLVEAPFSNFIS